LRRHFGASGRKRKRRLFNPFEFFDHTTLENPFANRRSDEEIPIPAVLVLAKLTDSTGVPLAFKAVSFSVRTYFGTLSLGNRATGADGVAKMKITDRRFGTYTVLASFASDESAARASNSFEVTAAPRAAPCPSPKLQPTLKSARYRKAA